MRAEAQGLSGKTAITDEQLAAAAKTGSSSAFDQLVERYRDRLLRFLLGRCGNRADAEDAIQDTFVNAYRYLQSYDSRWRFSTWLYRIAIRNAARQSLHTTAELVEIADHADPLASCIAQSDRQNLWLLAKRQLSADAYTALWLRYAEDLALADVARALDRSLTWTKVSLMRSRRRLTAAVRQEAVIAERSEIYGKV
jgi:RNA polymerase sigma-70 factor (ECF subfamily)